ncbi:MAG: hypothetical protein KA185_10155 [Vitreoscilla sp.]|nr:hypothetical protein [Vitreoscilla sp.]
MARHAAGEGVLKQAATRSFKLRAGVAIHLQVKGFASNQGDENLVHIQAVATEHALDTHRAQWREQLAAPVDEVLGHVARSGR